MFSIDKYIQQKQTEEKPIEKRNKLEKPKPKPPPKENNDDNTRKFIKL